MYLISVGAVIAFPFLINVIACPFLTLQSNLSTANLAVAEIAFVATNILLSTLAAGKLCYSCKSRCLSFCFTRSFLPGIQMQKISLVFLFPWTSLLVQRCFIQSCLCSIDRCPLSASWHGRALADHS